MSARQTTLVPDSFTDRQLREASRIEKVLNKADVEEQQYFFERRKKGPPVILFPSGNVGSYCVNALNGERLPFTNGSFASKLGFQVTDSRGKHFNYGNPVTYFFKHPDDYYMYYHGHGKDKYNESIYNEWESRHDATVKTIHERYRNSRSRRIISVV
jgi:hypothetical protein